MKISRTDTHQHVIDRRRFRYPWADGIPALLPDFPASGRELLLEAAGIDRVILVQAVEEAAETRRLLELADTLPWIAGIIGWADFLQPDIADTLTELGEHPRLKGWRMILQKEEPEFLLQPALAAAINRLAGSTTVFELLLKPGQLLAARTLVRSCPDVSFVLDHLAKPRVFLGPVQALGEWETPFRALLAETNVVGVKLSGLMTEALAPDGAESAVDPLCADTYEPYLAVALNAAAAHRVMLGTDFPVCLQASTAAMANWIAIAETCMQRLTVEGLEWDRIRSSNAQRIYCL